MTPPMMPPANPLPKPPDRGFVGWAVVGWLGLAAGFEVVGVLLKERPPPRDRASASSRNPTVRKSPMVSRAVNIVFILEIVMSSTSPFIAQ
jgi:hypothetical protein